MVKELENQIWLAEQAFDLAFHEKTVFCLNYFFAIKLKMYLHELQ